MEHLRKRIGYTLLAASFTLSIFASESDYPELMVSPRASQRIIIEANNEESMKWKTHLPMQISSVTTLLAGILQSSDVDTKEDPDERSPMVGMLVGGAWTAATFYMAAKYRPYRIAHESVKDLPNKSSRDLLMKERMAEEAINDAADFGRKLTWLSAITNAGASVYMLMNVKKDTTAQTMNALALVAAFTPILFPYHWDKVAQEQQGYKKKVYGTLSFNSTIFSPQNGKYAPGVLFTYNY